MSWQTIELNMIPDTKELPVVYASQFDSDRTISFQMFTGEDEWTIPEGLTIELHCRKVDDNIVTLAPTSVDGSVITFVTTKQLTACSGDNKCELSFIDENDLVIGSLNFILKVEADPIAGGLTSETAIYNLTQQIEDIAQEVIGEDYYDKTEVDTLLADKADVSDLPDMTQYYDKSQTDTLLNAKADKSDTYTKTQVDTALAAKANTADLATVATTGDYDDLINKPVIPAAQIQSDYAQADNTQVDYIKNKPDIDGMIAAAIFDILPIGQASGNPCNFETAIAGTLVSLTANITASGGYDADTQTEHPIVGYSEINLDVNGDTFTVSFGQTVYGGVYDANMGKVRITHKYQRGGFSRISKDTSNKLWLCGDLTDSKIYESIQAPNAISNMFVAKSLQNCRVDNSGFTIFPRGLYIAGYVGNESALDALLPNLEIAYELATPIEIDVSELSVSAIVGTNNIVSDGGGDVEVEYRDSIQHYIDTRS